jgi:hypothetical protein
MILPLDFRDIRFVLAKNGYELLPVRNLPPPPMQITYSGEIARFKENMVFANSEAGEIGVISRSVSDAYSSFGDLLKVLASEIGVNLRENVKYYEAILHCRVETGKKPAKEIAKAENKEFVNKFSEVLGENLSSLSIRLGKKDSSAKQRDWLDIAIDPDPIYDGMYHIGMIFRNPDQEKTETFVKNLENNLLKMIQLIEE